MIKRVFLLCIKISVALILVGNIRVHAQNSPSGDALEQLTVHFRSGLAQVQKLVGASNIDFGTFIQFNQQKINTEEGKLYSDILSGKINVSNIDNYEKDVVERYQKLYIDFLKIKAEYPSSVAEYSSYHPQILQTFTCDSACTNPDFSNGDLSGWYAAYGVNNSNFAPCFSTYFNITNVTGGQCIVGQQKAAQDPNTNNSYQVMIMHGGNDPVVPSVPRVSPFSASAYSARVGDSSNINYGVAILQQTFKVTATSQNFTYQYAVFLENPGHVYYNQPFFCAVVLDSLGDTIPGCGKYLVTSGFETGGGQGWDSTTVLQANVQTLLYYKNWTSVYTSLQHYIGHCVTVRFTVGDCAQSGHYGYAYVTTSCAPQQLISSSPEFCGQSKIVLTAPPGGNKYKWTGPTNGILGSDSTEVINIDSAGHYEVIITPVTGNPCNDTISINIPKGVGPPPIPSFKADTVCFGQSTQFTNTSTPLSGSGVKFYWDFYDHGSYEDSTSTNPLWLYNSAGRFLAKLHEVNNGCGADTLIPIQVDTPFTVSIIQPNKICPGTTVKLTAHGGGSYQWSNGATTSSIEVDPPVTTSYSVVVSKVCVESGSATVTVYASSLNACCNGETISLGDTVHLNAWGENNYAWSPAMGLNCTSCPTVIADPGITTTYTVTSVDSNGCILSRMLTVYVDTPCADFKVPNVFTPNNDGINDDFVINVLNPSSYKITIYDRWGKEMYVSVDPDKYWNGRIMNTSYLVPDGVYYYIINATCGINDYTKKGFVEVVGEK